MIMGDCPHCDRFVSTHIGQAACFSKEVCPHCKKEYWLRHSRFDPEAYQEKPKEVGKLIGHNVWERKASNE